MYLGLKRGSWIGAVLLLAGAAVHAQNTFPPPPPPEIQEWITKAAAELRNNNRNGSIEIIQSALDKYPDNYHLRRVLSGLYADAGRFDDAISIQQQIVRDDPGSSPMLSLLGDLYRRKGDIPLAIETFNRAIQTAPNDPRPLVMLGLLYSATGQGKLAERSYDQALRLQPDHPVAANNLAYLLAEEDRDLDRALELATIAIKAQPNSSVFADTVGWVHFKRNNHTEAIRYLGQAILRDMQTPTLQRHLRTVLDNMTTLTADQKELQELLRGDSDPERDGRIRQLLLGLGF